MDLDALRKEIDAIDQELLERLNRRVQLAQKEGHYKLERLIGQGAMAEVYLARALGGSGIGQRVALKRIRRDLAEEPHHLLGSPG